MGAIKKLRDITENDVKEAWSALRERKPLIFHITNDVAAPLQANVCLAVGASPLMSKHPAETEELAALSNGFLANLGTPTPDSIEAVNLGLTAASRLGRMTLLDPVGYGASRLRVELFDGILERHELSILKGNAGEISLMAGTGGATRGVDVAESGDLCSGVTRLARRHRCTACATGSEDILGDGESVALIRGATALQLRDKEADGGELFSEARQMLCLCRELGIPFFVNDRLDIALACSADGVHLGQSDLPVAEARRLAPRPFIIGASARTPEDANRAVRDGADYLGVGAVFPTGSKEDAQVIGLDGIRAITRAAAVPIVAIGGVSLDNLGEVMACGADGVAVISAAVRGDIPANMKRLREGLEYSPTSKKGAPQERPLRHLTLIDAQALSGTARGAGRPPGPRSALRGTQAPEAPR